MHIFQQEQQRLLLCPHVEHVQRQRKERFLAQLGRERLGGGGVGDGQAEQVAHEGQAHQPLGVEEGQLHLDEGHLPGEGGAGHLAHACLFGHPQQGAEDVPPRGVTRLLGDGLAVADGHTQTTADGPVHHLGRKMALALSRMADHIQHLPFLLGGALQTSHRGRQFQLPPHQRGRKNVGGVQRLHLHLFGDDKHADWLGHPFDVDLAKVFGAEEKLHSFGHLLADENLARLGLAHKAGGNIRFGAEHAVGVAGTAAIRPCIDPPLANARLALLDKAQLGRQGEQFAGGGHGTGHVVLVGDGSAKGGVKETAFVAEHELQEVAIVAGEGLLHPAHVLVYFVGHVGVVGRV